MKTEISSFSGEFLHNWSVAFANSFFKLIRKDPILSKIVNIRFRKHNNLAPWIPAAVIVDSSHTDAIEYTKTFEKNGFLTVIRGMKVEDSCLSQCAESGKLYHYATLSNLQQPLCSLISRRTLQKVKKGRRELRFERWSTSKQISIPLDEIEKLWVIQHMRHLSPCPPLGLLLDLMDNGLIDIVAAYLNNELAGFITLTKSSHIAHVNWALINKDVAKNYTSASLWFEVFKTASERGCVFLSMGSTSSISLAKFKESMGGKRAIGCSLFLSQDKVSMANSSTPHEHYRKQRLARQLLKLIMRLNRRVGLRWYSKISLLLWAYA